MTEALAPDEGSIEARTVPCARCNRLVSVPSHAAESPFRCRECGERWASVDAMRAVSREDYARRRQSRASRISFGYGLLAFAGIVSRVGENSVETTMGFALLTVVGALAYLLTARMVVQDWQWPLVGGLAGMLVALVTIAHEFSRFGADHVADDAIELGYGIAGTILCASAAFALIVVWHRRRFPIR